MWRICKLMLGYRGLKVRWKHNEIVLTSCNPKENIPSRKSCFADLVTHIIGMLLSPLRTWKYDQERILLRIDVEHLFSLYRAIDLLTDLMTSWVTSWLINWMIDWLADWLTDWVTDWLTDWLADWLTCWLTAWLTDWLTNWLADWLTD